MLWDQRYFELDGKKHVVNFYCYKWEDTTERILNDRYNEAEDLLPRVDYGVTHDCFFMPECWCMYPIEMNTECPNVEYTNDNCPLKRIYDE